MFSLWSTKTCIFVFHVQLSSMIPSTHHPALPKVGLCIYSYRYSFFQLVKISWILIMYLFAPAPPSLCHLTLMCSDCSFKSIIRSETVLSLQKKALWFSTWLFHLDVEPLTYIHSWYDCSTILFNDHSVLYQSKGSIGGSWVMMPMGTFCCYAMWLLSKALYDCITW